MATQRNKPQKKDVPEQKPELAEAISELKAIRELLSRIAPLPAEKL